MSGVALTRVSVKPFKLPKAPNRRALKANRGLAPTQRIKRLLSRKASRIARKKERIGA
jgi:hypothetical protein